MRELTHESVKQLYASMTQFYDTELIDHWFGDRAASMNVLRSYLKALGIKDVEFFLDRHDMNLGDEVYIPWAPGDRAVDPLVQVVACARVHERVSHWHAQEYPDEARMMYLLSPTMRMEVELAVLRAELEVLRHFGIHADATTQIRMLERYGCSDIAINVGKCVTEMLNEVFRGEVKSMTAPDIIGFYGLDKK